MADHSLKKINSIKLRELNNTYNPGFQSIKQLKLTNIIIIVSRLIKLYTILQSTHSTENLREIQESGNPILCTFPFLARKISNILRNPIDCVCVCVRERERESLEIIFLFLRDF